MEKAELLEALHRGITSLEKQTKEENCEQQEDENAIKTLRDLVAQLEGKISMLEKVIEMIGPPLI